MKIDLGGLEKEIRFLIKWLHYVLYGMGAVGLIFTLSDKDFLNGICLFLLLIGYSYLLIWIRDLDKKMNLVWKFVHLVIQEKILSKIEDIQFINHDNEKPN